MITQAQVQHLFDYKDGELFWKNTSSPRVKNGDRAGYLDNGYRKVRVGNKIYRAHRVIFLFHNGYLPKYVDHIDGNPLNNRIENLREATHSQNMCNRSLNANSTSGHKGVHWNKSLGKWQGFVTKDRKQYSTSVTDDIQEAIRAVENLRKQLHGAFARYT